MNLFSKLLGALLLILFSAATQAQNYYICDTGDDANDGKSESKPFKTHTKAMATFNKMFAGDSILYCRGGKFYADTHIRTINTRCGASNVCTIADYGSAEKTKPIIYGVGEIPFNFQNGGDSKPDGGYVLKNLDLIAIEPSDAGIMLYNEVNDLVVDNFHIEGFNIGFYSAGANKSSSSNRKNDRIVLKNSTIINNKRQGWLGGCNDCLIENNHFENNGNLPVYDHNIYIDSPAKEQSFYNQGITIRNNTLTKANIVNGKCSGVSLVVHGIIKDLVIDNNLIKEEAGKVTTDCWGIGVDPGNKLDESFVNVKITNNKLINVGNTGIGCASCVNVLISNNTIIDEGDILRSGISVPNKKSEDSIKSKNVVIENNKIILNHDLGYGINLGGSNPFEVRNNNISTNVAKNRSNCFMLTDANKDINVSNNNCGTHTEVSIIDQIETNPPVEPEPPPSDVVEDVEVVEVEPVDELVASEPSAGPAESDDTENQIVDTELVNENTDVVTNPTDNVQTPSTGNAGNDGSPNDFTTTQPPVSKVANTVTNGSKISVNEQQAYDDGSTSLTNNKPRNAAGGSSSGGGSSKSKTSSTSDNDLAVTDDVISYTTPVTSVDTSTSAMSVESEQMDISNGLPKTDTESSKYSVKVKDVIEASRNDVEITDVTQCRAYAAGKCLMK